MEPFKAPEAANMPKKEVYRLAERVCQKLKFVPGGDINELVKDFGGEVIFQDMDDWLVSEDGSIKVRGEKDFTIYVSNFTGVLRNRFTIAHELGHYILHSKFGKERIQVARNGASDRVEWEANWFAAGLLMPEQEFLRQIEICNDVQYLGSYFFVSPSAVEVRMRNINE